MKFPLIFKENAIFKIFANKRNARGFIIVDLLAFINDFIENSIIVA